MRPLDLMWKAERALAGARLLLDANDGEGVCSRAYYAMFDAARAVVLARTADTTQASIKTHRGLIAAFGEQLVKTGHVDAELGRSLNRVQNLRMTADYMAERLTIDDARWAIDEAETFVVTLRARLAEL